MQAIDKSHIEDRLTDWRERIGELYDEIANWLHNDPQYRFERSNPTTLEEDMMEKFGVSKIQLPTANIFRHNKLVTSLKPKGLWVIGANGRVDLISKSKPIMLLDLADHFQPAEWHIVYSKNWHKRLPLNKLNLIKVLNTL